MLWECIGFTAAALTTFSFLPQIYQILKTRSVKDVSLLMLLQLSLGVLLWIVYGVHLKNIVIISANSVTLSSLVILLVVYYRFKKKKG